MEWVGILHCIIVKSAWMVFKLGANMAMFPRIQAAKKHSACDGRVGGKVEETIHQHMYKTTHTQHTANNADATHIF